MDSKDLPEALSAAVLQFCQDHVQYTGHLSVHGSITLIADSTTTIGFFSKALPEKYEANKGRHSGNSYQSFGGNLSHSFIQDTSDKGKDLLPAIESSPPLVCENPGGAAIGTGDSIHRWAAKRNTPENPVAVLEHTHRVPIQTRPHLLGNSYNTASVPQSSQVNILPGQPNIKTEQAHFDEEFSPEVSIERIGIGTYNSAVVPPSSNVNILADQPLVKSGQMHFNKEFGQEVSVERSRLGTYSALPNSEGPALSQQQGEGISHFSLADTVPQETPPPGGGADGAYASNVWAEARKKKGTTGQFCCTYCSKQFETKYRLTRHVRTHTGEKPFACETCGKRFNQAENLNSHRLTHPLSKPFKCEGCQGMYFTQQSVTEHKHQAKVNKRWDCFDSAAKQKRLYLVSSTSAPQEPSRPSS